MRVSLPPAGWRRWGFVRGKNRAAHHQPRTPKPGVPCCIEERQKQLSAHSSQLEPKFQSVDVGAVKRQHRKWHNEGKMPSVPGDSGLRHIRNSTRLSFAVYLSPARWRGRGSSALFRPLTLPGAGPKGSQGRGFGILHKGSSRKSSPAASERRPSFSPFFLGEARKRAGKLGTLRGWGRI